MSLQKTTIEVRPSGGLQEDASKWLPVPFHRLNNYLYRRIGAVEKRSGFGPLPTDTYFSSSWSSLQSVVGTPAGELLAIGILPPATLGSPGDPGTYLWSYSSRQELWSPRTHLPGIVLDRYPGVRGQQDIGEDIPMLCRIGTLECVTFVIGTTGYCRIVDRATGAVVLDNAELASNVLDRIAVFNCGDAQFTFVWIRNSNELRTAKVDPDTLLTTPALVLTYPANVSRWDVVPTVGSHWCVAAVMAGVPPTDIIVDRVNNATQTSVATVTEAAEGDSTISLGYRFGYDRLLMAWDNRLNVRAKTFIETTLATDLAAFNVEPTATWTYALRAVTCNFDDLNRLFVVMVGEVTLYQYGTWFRVYEPSGASTGGTVILAWWNLPQGKPFRTTAGLMLPLARWYDDTLGFDFGGRYGTCLVNLNRHFNLVNLGTPSARPPVVEGVVGVADALGYPREAVERSLPWIQTLSGGETAYLPFLVAGAGSVLQKDPRAWVDVAEIAVDPQADGQWTTAYASRLVHCSGALATQYDGQSAVEAAWFEPPQYQPGTVNIVLGVVGLEGATPTPNRYTYLFVWEWVDAQGQIHESRLSDPFPVDVGTSGVLTRGIVSFEVRTTSLTRRGDRADGVDTKPRLAVYRTKANGTTYYRCKFTAEYNDPAVPTIAYTDDEDDATLEAALRGGIYTAGGVLEKETPPPARHIQAGAGRVWLTSAELPEVWPSSELLQGEAPAWSSITRITVDDAQTPLVGTAILDGLLVIFSESRVYTLPAAAGPGPTGIPPWPRPEEVQSSTGCVSSRSIVAFEMGVAYQDADGIKLLTRARTIENLGAPIQETVATYPTVADAVLDAKNERIVWMLTGSEGTVLAVYDYRYQAWSTWSTSEDLNASRLSIWQNEIVTPQSSLVQRLRQSTTEPGYDHLGGAPEWVVGTLETPWIFIGALGAYQRVWRVVLEMEKLSAHGFTLDVYADGEETTPVQTETWTEAQVDALQGLPRQRVVVGIAQQKCQSIKFRITDSAPLVDATSDPTGHRYHGLSLEIGQKYGAEKAQKANTRLCRSLSLFPSPSAPPVWPAASMAPRARTPASRRLRRSRPTGVAARARRPTPRRGCSPRIRPPSGWPTRTPTRGSRPEACSSTPTGAGSRWPRGRAPASPGRWPARAATPQPAPPRRRPLRRAEAVATSSPRSGSPCRPAPRHRPARTNRRRRWANRSSSRPWVSSGRWPATSAGATPRPAP